MITRDRFVAYRKIAAVLPVSRLPEARQLYPLYHLQHKRASVPEQIIPRPDPAKKLIHYPYLRLVCRHKAAGLRQNRDNRRLPEERRLPSLIRAGNDVQVVLRCQAVRVGHK